MTEGTNSLSKDFTLSAGQQTPGTCTPGAGDTSYCYTITTSSENTGSGSLMYVVSLTPTSGNTVVAPSTPGSKIVTVTVQ